MAEETEEVVAGGPNDTSQHGEAAEDPAKFFEESGGNGQPKEEGDAKEPPAAGDEPTPEPEPEPTPEPEPAPEPEAVAAPTEGKKSGAIIRKYKVFVERHLTEAVLRSLLKEVTDGNDGKVPVVHLELDELDARNPEGALKQAFKANRAQLGDEATLTATPAGSWKPQPVKPKPVVDEDVEVG